LIATAGTHATLVEFLDKGRSGMASTFLTRLRVGGKLVDAKSVHRLYRSRLGASALLWLVFVVVLVVAVVSATAVARNHDLNGQRAQVGALQQQVQALQTHGAGLQTQLDAGTVFAQGVEPLAVAGRLSGEPVVVIVAPNAPTSVLDTTLQSLADSGATLTGVIDIRSSFVDPAQVTSLGELSSSLSATAPSQNVPTQAAAVLASALVGQPPAPSAGSSTGGTLDAASTEILAGLAQGGYISVAQAPTQHARLAVIVAPTPAVPPSRPTTSGTGSRPTTSGTGSRPTTSGTASRPTTSGTASRPTTSGTASRDALVALVAAFPAAGSATVVAGASGSAADGGLLAALRAPAAGPSSTAAVSTVDDADGPAGSIAVIMALQAEQAQSGSAAGVGHYGTGPGARALLPAPPPS
jgi:Copper transport outer membrane protein, MctB